MKFAFSHHSGVAASVYIMCVNMLQQIQTFGIVPGSGCVDYAQSLIKKRINVKIESL
jgi:hypothetical protein